MRGSAGDVIRLKNPCGQNPLALAGRENRARTCTLTQYELLGSEPPHEMSYPTAQTLQYGVTRAQESGPARPHVPTSRHCTACFPPHRCFTAARGLPHLAVQERRLRGVLTALPAHIEYLSRAALKRRHVSFSQDRPLPRSRLCTRVLPRQVLKAGIRPSVQTFCDRHAP